MTLEHHEWQPIVRRALLIQETPFYLFAWEPIQAALDALTRISGPVPIRHWLSFKTHPFAPLVREWNRLGLGVEVVSRYELDAVLAEGFPASRILVNGVLKHAWLAAYTQPGLSVHFDSYREVEALAPVAEHQNWTVGLRLQVHQAFDPDEPDYPSQFGMTLSEAGQSIAVLGRHGLAVKSIHFHLRSNVDDIGCYQDAITEVAAACGYLNIAPEYLDIGGGFPVPGERRPGSDLVYPDLTLGFARAIEEATIKLPSIRAVWMENGRFLSGRSGVLVITVLDRKERLNTRFLICDGGRTNHALVSDWERHSIFRMAERTAAQCWTTVAGPTCMAFDRLLRAWLPEDITVGDVLVWTGAGAYHLPWETRFSHGHAPVLWYDRDGQMTLVRERESFGTWWGGWRSAGNP
jgi:diaminopimelate decarboxylase